MRSHLKSTTLVLVLIAALAGLSRRARSTTL